MAPRLKVIEELTISYEVPYITERGEIIDRTIIQINERRRGMDISYVLVDPAGQELDNLFPAEGVDYLAKMTKEMLQYLSCFQEM